MRLDKDKIKTSLTKEDMNKLLLDLGSGEPKSDGGGNPIYTTVCHAHQDGKYKLYYYEDSQSLHCYNNCGQLDVYSLVMQVKEQQGFTFTFPEAVKYVAEVTGKSYTKDRSGFNQLSNKVSDWEYIERFKPKPKMKKELPSFNENVLDVFLPYLNDWIDEGITPEIARKFEIGYYFKREQITIPNRSMDGRLIGIRSRNTDPELVEAGLKYIPTQVSGQDYRFLSMYNLYGLYHTQEAIRRIKKCMIFEGEKSVMKAEALYGDDNFTVATYGMNISSWHRNTILSLGVDEVFIAFDKFREKKELESEEHYEDMLLDYQKKLVRLAHMFTPYCRVYILYDLGDLLEPRDAPIDQGQEVFETLMKNKIEITTKEESIV